LGKSTITTEEFEAHSEFSANAVSRRFGSWRAAMQLVGLQTAPSGKRYSDDECFENLLQVWTHYGRQPQHREMKLPPSTVGPKAYTLRWGTWLKALEAFVDKMNQGDEPGEASTCDMDDMLPAKPEEPQSNQSRTMAGADIRDIKLGLRWKVFQRDRFRCVKCGASPATDPTCEQLHADHILPFSKGGKTVLENLQTLCQRCNLGKGSRLEE
jgi:predicted restriction endonuclease